jgi:NAD-dependent dihydropyrimidine dehydrogenase PreA subunit
MRIDPERCEGGQSCIAYCPVGAIRAEHAKVFIDQDLCVECSVCLRSGVCQSAALYQPALEWPRSLRAKFSDPLLAHPATGIKGRGTVEMKTNDVSGRFGVDEVGFVIEVGRPGVTALLADVETLTTVLAGWVEFEPLSPITSLLDAETGTFKDASIRDERVLSAIIECKASEDRAITVLTHLQEVAGRIETVFSLGVIARCEGFGIPTRAKLEAAGYQPRGDGKTNVGLGRPLA